MMAIVDPRDYALPNGLRELPMPPTVHPPKETRDTAVLAAIEKNTAVLLEVLEAIKALKPAPAPVAEMPKVETPAPPVVAEQVKIKRRR